MAWLKDGGNSAIHGRCDTDAVPSDNQDVDGEGNVTELSHLLTKLTCDRHQKTFVENKWKQQFVAHIANSFSKS